MFGFKRKRSGRDLVHSLHQRIVEASRDPDLYGSGGLPDTTEGRFESLTLHILLVLRRLRNLPPPADDVGQDLVDATFSHLEIALREMGVGDFGVPKRMKTLAQAFYDRVARYDLLLDGGDPGALRDEIARRLEREEGALTAFVGYLFRADRALAEADLDALLIADLAQLMRSGERSAAEPERVG